MRCRPATILLVLGLWATVMAGQALSGPWPRDPGDVFLAFSVGSDSPTSALAVGDPVFDTNTGLYGEIGLGRRLTLGGQIGQSETAEDAVMFLRYTLTPPHMEWQAALDAGAGLRRETGRPDRDLLRLGLSIGRALSGSDMRPPLQPFRYDGGWITLDAVGLLDHRTSEVIWQAEATLGLSVSDRLRLMLQAKAEEWPGADPVYTVTPGAAWSLGTRTTAQIGLRLAQGAQETTTGLTLGLWHSF